MDEENETSPNKDEFRDKARKRRYSLCEQDKDDSQNHEDNIENGPPENKVRLIATPFRLLDFSDEVLYEIFKHLDSWTLMALMNSCTRLGSLILDSRFWRYIDLSKEPLPLGILEDVLERSQRNTTCIKLHGPPIAQHLEREDKQFSLTLAKAFATCCTNLSVLELQGITIDFRFVQITNFPKSLKRLVLNDCNIRFEGQNSIFLNMDTHLTKLEELSIENSSWFEPYYMMVFSKVPRLRSLSLKGCQLLCDFVPYGSMAARFGFKKLEYLDLRFTPISDSDLQCFNAVATLKEVLLDCPTSLRENSVETGQGTKMKWHSRLNAEAANGNSDSDNESPSTSNASRLKITVSVSSASERNNESGASTSAAAAQKSQSETSQGAQQNNQERSEPGREEDSSLSSCSSSPSASSSSSNESLPPLLANPPRLLQNPIEIPMPGGNAPPFSRFLPRPDQIILLDLNNRWRRVVMQNLPANRENGIDGQQQQQQQGQLEENPQAQQQQQQQDRPLQQQQQEPEQLQILAQDRLHPHERPVVLHHNNNNNNIDDNNGNNNHNGNHIEQVLSHPLFWDMINPFARVGRSGLRRLGRDDEGEHVEPGRRIECRRFQCSGQFKQCHRHRYDTYHQPITDRGICCFGRPRNPVEHGIIWIRIGNRPSENRFERLSIRNYKLVTDVSLQHLVQCSPYLVYLDLSGTGVTQRGIDTFKERKPQCVIVADHLPIRPSAQPPTENCDDKTP